MATANGRRLYNIASAVVLALLAGQIIREFRAEWFRGPSTDDAYMFARYAANIRHGLGIAWNPDGVHTYGQTSLLWCGVITALSYLPLGTGTMLVLASQLCAIGALVALAWAVAVNAKSDLFSSTWRVLPWVALPLVGSSLFRDNAGNGMETMLAALLCALFVGLALGWCRATVQPELAGLVGFLLFLTRPESGIVVLLLPSLLFLVTRKVGAGSLARLLGAFLAGVVLDLVACKLYFHTALPLSFYMKSWHGYQGYTFLPDLYPELRMLAFFAACQLYLVAMVFLSRKEDWRLLICCVAPAVVMCAYLQTVLQIVGISSRYYVPYFALFVVPSLLVVDRWLAARRVRNMDPEGFSEDASVERLWPGKTLLVRSCLAAGVMLFCFAVSSDGLMSKLRRAENKTLYAYDAVQFDLPAKTPLPITPWSAMTPAVTSLLVQPLPRGATVAASEVGFLGSSAPQVNIIDLVGLNDTQIALHGFDPSALLARKPDIIWMPHDAYTYQRGVMLSDPELLRQYDLYAGAANYGLAVRKDSPFRGQIDQRMQVFWNDVYPGYRMSDYLVKRTRWTGQKHRILDE